MSWLKQLKSRFKLLRFTIVISMSIFFLPACAFYGAARIRSNPPQAEVISLDDDTLLGTTPFVAFWKSSNEGAKMITVRFQKIDYKNKVTAFTIHITHSSKESALASPQDVDVQLERKEK